jgi:hypothetical protein
MAANPLFTGRHQELQQLARQLQHGAALAIHAVAATGMGGIGKTQLACEFAHRYGRYFPGGVFWLSFANSAAVPDEIAACGGPDGLNLPGFNALERPDQVAQI